jgi:heme/copper-type cytochrome/quinol oxidase subunit 1
MASIAPTLELPHHADHAPAGWVRRYVFSIDHKTIGLQFLFAGLAYFVLGGSLAMLMRWQLAWPNDPAHPVPILGKLLGWSGGMMPFGVYNMILTMHASVMIFFVLIPLQVGAFGNYLIPLKIGARDMAFPFLNGLAFWMFVPAGTIVLAGVCLVGGGAATGWTAYPPISAIQYNQTGFVPAARGALSILQINGSTWPTLPIAVNFAALFMLFAFVGTHAMGRPTIGAEPRRREDAKEDEKSITPDSSRLPSRLRVFAVAWFDAFGRLHVPVVIAGAIVMAALAVRAIQAAAFDGQSCWFLGLILLGFSSTIGAVNYLTTIVRDRCPGMTMFRLPLTVWALFITSILTLLATPVLGSVLLMNLMDHHRLSSFFEPANWTLSQSLQSNAGGGYVLLDPHLFWFYSHPAVYIMILPAMGMVSDILPVFARKPIFGYRPMIYAMGAIAFLGFLVWGHHMFQSGMNPAMGAAFAVSTLFIAVPSAIKTFNWLATLWGGSNRLTVPMLNAVAFVSLFVIGGLSGIIMSSTAIDAQLHMTYFIVAHIHYVLFGGSTFGLFAAIYYWYPKMFGRMMNAKLGYVHFGLSYIAFNCTFFTMHFLGLQGLPRRVADYTNYTLWKHLQPMNEFITISAFCLGLAQIPFIINFIGSWIWGEPAGDNPWEASTLEWTNATSPPAAENFAVIPVVHHGPYEYGSPHAAGGLDYVPQSAPA